MSYSVGTEPFNGFEARGPHQRSISSKRARQISGKPREPSAEDLVLGFAQNVSINQMLKVKYILTR